MKYFHLILAAFLILSSCSQESDTVLTQDIEKHLNTTAHDEAAERLAQRKDFWQARLDSDPGNHITLQKIASINAQEFKMNHDLNALLESDIILLDLHERFPKNVSILHRLVTNSISKHAFNDALLYAETALDLGEKKDISQLLIVDVYLEKGMRDDARYLLEQLGNPGHFDRQIRWAKLYDAEGNLDQAVITMEAALANADASKNRDLMSWSLSNLGDMYGHQGKIKKSYETYLKALELDPADAHSLKGIGWIAFSHDKDNSTALRIWSFLNDLEPNPELDLLLSQVYHELGEPMAENLHLEAFISTVGQEKYGNMYGSYLVSLMTVNDQGRALEYAQKDIAQREHPMTYSKLALALHAAGEDESAVQILKEHVIDQTGEPIALFTMAKIFDDLGQKSEADHFLNEALSASYELGPVASKEIQSRLEKL